MVTVKHIIHCVHSLKIENLLPFIYVYAFNNLFFTNRYILYRKGFDKLAAFKRYIFVLGLVLLDQPGNQ